MDIRTLQYWHKLEHFYPYILQPQKHENISTERIGESRNLPDFHQHSVGADKIIRGYCVYLGIFKVEPALQALEEGIGRKMRFRDSGEDESCFCMFRLTPEGIIRLETFQISSFPWAIHRVRDGKIYVDQWDEDFLEFQKSFFAVLSKRETPVDFDFLYELREAFADRINWKIDYCENWLRIDRVMGKKPQEGSGKNQQAEETEEGEDEQEEIRAEDEFTDEQVKKNDLLNSFYIRDLERVIAGVESGEYGEAFCRFLTHQTAKRVDIERDSDTLFALMAPENLPLGRWPSKYGARLMQQVDVNAFLTVDSRFQQPLFSVNGPPGTGKTTLLKDVIAAVITQRACAMLDLRRPNDAFCDQAIAEIQYKDKGYPVWKLRPEWEEYGIIVASNNNGAVENITHGLPRRKELPEQYDIEKYRYFSEVSDRMLGQGQTWALNAVALGRKKNRERFYQNFWPLTEEEEKELYNLRKKLQSIKTFSRERWVSAQEAFSKARDAVKAEYARIQKAYSAVAELRNIKKELIEAERDIPLLETKLAALEETLISERGQLAQAEDQQKRLESEIQYLRSITPFLGIREVLFPHSVAVEEFNMRRVERSKVRENVYLLSQRVEKTQQVLKQTQNALAQRKKAICDGQQRIDELQANLEDFRKETGMPFRIDEYFEDCGAEEHGKSSPWGYQKLNELREKLFLEALQLHKAFIEGSSRLRKNLDSCSKLLREMLPIDQEKSLTAPLLQSLFLVVPVISTTFASVGSFLRFVPAEEIAYLFIDEAGQAVPQSAAGAIWRAKKVIAVGDPLQIEPVVTLHDTVIELLGAHFDRERILLDKYTSAQTLADLSNQLGGWRQVSQDQDLWIGAPLVVHSRCQRRVFDIANRIAYNDKMIYDTPQRADTVCKWLNVVGASQSGHYVPAQAEAAVGIVCSEFLSFLNQKKETEKYPSLFVITPFRSTRAGLTSFFRRELLQGLGEAGVDVTSRELKSMIQLWLRECVGTIHTFQGKEANTVLLCLGVGSDRKSEGAVDWAGERPNILNVAVTRAKERLYIVADREVWGKKEYFKTAWDFCENT